MTIFPFKLEIVSVGVVNAAAFALFPIHFIIEFIITFGHERDEIWVANWMQQRNTSFLIVSQSPFLFLCRCVITVGMHVICPINIIVWIIYDFLFWRKSSDKFWMKCDTLKAISWSFVQCNPFVDVKAAMAIRYGSWVNFCLAWNRYRLEKLQRCRNHWNSWFLVFHFIFFKTMCEIQLSHALYDSFHSNDNVFLAMFNWHTTHTSSNSISQCTSFTRPSWFMNAFVTHRKYVYLLLLLNSREFTPFDIIYYGMVLWICISKE